MAKTENVYDEASRQFTICNACRYCESYCPVWPAMERRTIFDKKDLVYMANVCHDCQACYHACPYTPPHEIAVNIPRVLSEIRLESYKEYASPGGLRVAFEKGWKWPALAALLGILVVAALALLLGPADRLVAPQGGPGSFYDIFPYVAIVGAGLAVGLYVLMVYLHGVGRFFRDSLGRPIGGGDAKALLLAAGDALLHRGFRGGGAGCYHDETIESRRFYVLHMMVVYGFLSALASTILAAIYQDGLGRLPPYNIISAPVLLGILGGLMMIFGTLSLIYIDARAKEAGPIFGKMKTLDFAFLVNITLVSMTGLATLALRDGGLLGTVFILHMGLVLALFVTAPYGKFVHFSYRYAALTVSRIEEAREAATAARAAH